VSWAGPEPAPVWLDAARDFSEYWTHQQQICDATGQAPCPKHPLPLASDIINLEHQLDPGGRPPSRTVVRNCPPGGADAHAAALQRHIRARLGTAIRGDPETEDAGVEADRGVEIVGKDLSP